MADEVLSDVDNAVHVGGTGESRDRKCEEAVTPTMVVTSAGNTDGSVRPANSGVAGENVYGVAGVPLGGDPDTEVAIGIPIPVFQKGSGAIVWCTLKPESGPVPVEEGDIIIEADEDGLVSLGDESAVAAKAGQVVGVCQMYSPGHATDNKMIRVKI